MTVRSSKLKGQIRTVGGFTFLDGVSERVYASGMKALLLTLLVLASAQAAQAQYNIESKYDLLTDKTTVRMFYLHVGRTDNDAINLEAYYKYKGQGDKISPPDTVFLEFISGGSLSFGTNATLFVLCDGERIELQENDSSDGVRRAVYPVQFERMRDFVRAVVLEMRVGSVDIKLSPISRKAFREFMPRKVSQ